MTHYIQAPSLDKHANLRRVDIYTLHLFSDQVPSEDRVQGGSEAVHGLQSSLHHLTWRSAEARQLRPLQRSDGPEVTQEAGLYK